MTTTTSKEHWDLHDSYDLAEYERMRNSVCTCPSCGKTGMPMEEVPSTDRNKDATFVVAAHETLGKPCAGHRKTPTAVYRKR